MLKKQEILTQRYLFFAADQIEKNRFLVDLVGVRIVDSEYPKQNEIPTLSPGFARI